MKNIVSESMGIYTFGKELLSTCDLDPVYNVLWEAQLERPLLKRWLLSYACYYHVGTASWISDVQEKDEGVYWERMRKAAASKDYPRSAERRHYRGEAAKRSVEYLAARGVDDLFTPLLIPKAPLAYIIREVRTWVEFGPWISFKMADLLERLGLCKVTFDAGTVFLYKSPKEGAECLWANEKDDEEFIPDNVGEWATNRILEELGSMKAPPRYERTIGVAEAETILCKFHSYLNGHYHIGEDIEAVRTGLLRFGTCKLAKRLHAAGRRAKLWVS